MDHMISAGHYLATHAGAQILQAGGNAIDAGVAAGIALGVVQSDIVNVGGVAPCLVYHAQTGKVWSISGLGYWPRAASLDLFLDKYGGRIPAGVLRTVIPAAPDAWITALERFGTMSFGDVAAAAIGFARDGFVMYPLMAEVLADHQGGHRPLASCSARPTWRRACSTWPTKSARMPRRAAWPAWRRRGAPSTRATSRRAWSPTIGRTAGC